MLAGQAIAHYHVLEKVGEGGMGVVFRARDERLGRDVAIKILPADFASDPLRRKRFEQEARAAAAVNHANVATVFGIEETGDELAIIYEFVQGRTLRALAGRPLETKLLLDIAVETARALAAAHEHGVVHRDIKPENIMYTGEAVKVLDFGLARVSAFGEMDATRSQALTSEGVAVGTVGYMSPEQLETKPVDSRSDVFSFGVVLYELATGVNPFRGDSSASTIARILTIEPPGLQSSNPLAPAELERIVRKCLRKDPRERYQSTRDLVVDLDALRRTLTTASSSQTLSVPAAGDGVRKLPARIAAGMQMLFAFPYVAFLFMFSSLWENIGKTLKWEQMTQRSSMIGGSLFVLLVYVVQLVLIFLMLRARRSDLLLLRRAFPVLLGLNGFPVYLTCVFTLLWIGQHFGVAAGLIAAPFTIGVAVYLPFLHRRLLRTALGEAPRPA